jgi:GMP synthase (glutamine-hydrolysing)
MILIVRIINKKFHYFEFVKPIEDILMRKKIGFESINYKNLNGKMIDSAKKIIITGTSLKDNEFLGDIDKFKWIKKFDKPILGICGGMHILGLIYEGILKKQQEIGLNEISFIDEFLGYKNKIEVYELHNFYVFSEEYKIFAYSDKCLQAIKHKKKSFFGVLFHPEVRNKDLILNFANI